MLQIPPASFSVSHLSLSQHQGETLCFLLLKASLGWAHQNNPENLLILRCISCHGRQRIHRFGDQDVNLFGGHCSADHNY